MRKLFLPLATVILLAAACLRLWQISEYPPGPHYDEAVYLLITRSIAFGGARFFPIVEAYQGREVLYMYLNAPLLQLLGDRILTLKLSSAFLNLMTVAASIGLGRAMFRGNRGLVIGLAVGVLITLSFPQIWLARQAFRAVSQPAMQALALWLLWRGLRSPRYWGIWLAVAGGFAGGTLYTYMASRLFPFWLALGGLALLLADRAHWKLRLRQGIVFYGVMIVTALPMVIYAVERPDIFFNRLEEVTQSSEAVSLMDSIVLHLKMFFIDGDPYLRYNIPHRPYFTWPEGMLLLIGIVVAARRLVNGKSFDAPERAAYALALLSPLMVIPSVISTGGLPPSHMRSLGMIPLIYVLVATGFEALLGVVTTQRQWNALYLRPQRLLLLTVLGTLLIGGALVGSAYFAWASRADVFYETDADLDAATTWLIAQQDAGRLANTIVYVAAKDRNHPTMAVQPIPPVRWLGTDTLIRAPEGSEGLYIFPRSVPPPSDWLAWLEPGRINDLPLGPDGRTAFEAFHVRGSTPLPDSFEPAAVSVRNPYLTLVGMQAGAVAAGERGDVVMAWRADVPVPVSDYTPILSLEDANETQLFRVHQVLTGTDMWRPGEVLMDRIPVDVPVGTPPGDYAVRVAWVARERNDYSSYLDDDGTQAGIWATIGTLTVTRPEQFPEPSTLTIAHPSVTDAAPGVRLLGWETLAATRRPGEMVPVRLYWQAIPVDGQRANPLLQFSLQSAGAGATLVWQGTITEGRYPTGEWRDGELVTDTLYIPLSREQASGTYTLLMTVGEIPLSLGSVDVSGIARVFERPPVQQESDAVFGRAIELSGYTVRPGNDTLTIDLVWHARTVVTEDLKVFVHLVDAEGNIVDQRDAMPQDNRYPTTLWDAGEYITDSYTFPMSTRTVAARIGFYNPDNGQRLPVITVDDSGVDYIIINFS